jgi:hypothetical protein
VTMHATFSFVQTAVQVGVSKVLEARNPNPDLTECTGIVIVNQSSSATKIGMRPACWHSKELSAWRRWFSVSVLEVLFKTTPIEPITLKYIGVNSMGQQLDGQCTFLG